MITMNKTIPIGIKGSPRSTTIRYKTRKRRKGDSNIYEPNELSEQQHNFIDAGDSDKTAGQPATIFHTIRITKMTRTAMKKGILEGQTKALENGLWESRLATLSLHNPSGTKS